GSDLVLSDRNCRRDFVPNDCDAHERAAKRGYAAWGLEVDPRMRHWSGSFTTAFRNHQFLGADVFDGHSHASDAWREFCAGWSACYCRGVGPCGMAERAE